MYDKMLVNWKRGDYVFAKIDNKSWPGKWSLQTYFH